MLTNGLDNQAMDKAGKMIVGVLLAGGLSRRMGGGDKGLLQLGDQPMMAHALNRLAPQVDHMIINANGDPTRFAEFDLPVVADTMAGTPGPLAGVLAGLKWTKANRPNASHIVTASSDAPFLPKDLAQRLYAAIIDTGHPIALAASGGNRHPVIGLWPVALSDDLEQQLGRGVRKVLAWTDTHGFATVEFPFADIGRHQVDPFFNANTPEELDEARRVLQTTGDIAVD